MVQTMTVAEAFNETLSRVELNPTRVELASQRYNAVKSRIEAALSGKTVRQVGSFQRRTKTRPQNSDDPFDIDAIVSFGSFTQYAASGTRGTTPADALQVVRSALEGDRTYELMQPRVDAPTVTLRYADGFRIELIPCFEDATGQHIHLGGPVCYIVGKSDGGWMPADYDFDAQIITGANQTLAVGARLVPAIKLIKTFMRNRNLGFKSFHVEVLVALTVPAILAHWTAQGFSTGYDLLVAGFLLEVPRVLQGPVSLPGSYSLPVDSGFSIAELQDRGRWLSNRGEAARAICGFRDEGAALNGWRELFGDPFPA